MKAYFFVGKGGTGKTTLSASFGIGISRKNKTLIASLDPAHNLGDTLDLKIPDCPIRISGNLYAVEINIERIVLKYLSDISSRMKNTFRHLSVMNIDKYFDILKNSPGMEEYATLEVIKDYVNSNKYEVIVFDTPPTGITLKILGMPEVSILWTERLIELRRKILSRRKMIENVEKPLFRKGKEIVREEDPIMKELLGYREEMKNLRDFLSSNNCSVNIVMTPEKISLFETTRILDFLKRFKIKPGMVYINKFMKFKSIPAEFKEKIKEQTEVVNKLKEVFSNLVIREVPFVKKFPYGLEMLHSFYENYLLLGENR